jgi:hypothetical protein
MHPLLARYLDLETTASAIDTIGRGGPTNDDERALAAVLRRAPEHTAAVMDARGRKHPDEAVQQALVYLAANAAVEQLRDEPATVAAMARADLALRAQGASDAQVATFLATVLLEEAFGYEDDPETFDRALVVETLQGIPALAALDADKVEQLREGLKGAVPEKALEAAQTAFDALLEAAWSEGPEPLNPEHLAQAADALEGTPARAQLEPVLRHLMAHEILGPERLARLLARLSER